MWGGGTFGSMMRGDESPRGAWIDREKADMDHGELLTVRNDVVQMINPCYRCEESAFP